MNLAPVTEVGLNRIKGRLTDGDDALSPTLSKEAHGAVV
jgi:hypothetical protein